MTTIFLTGFPGFLGSELVERLLARYAADVTVTCLIQSKFRDQAAQRVDKITSAHPDWKNRIPLIEGDITQPDLGLDAAQLAALQQETIEIFHFAAVYALGVSREMAMRVNVDGTRHMLRFAEQCPQLHRFQYVSTCYVSGRHDGTFSENDLKNGQHFNNYYEETKYWAELEVRQHMQKGLPVTIYRPAIVVGDSQTGETQKYDGPYYIFQLILRQGKQTLMPVVGDLTQCKVNLVPRDFVTDAIDYLSAQKHSLGQTYHLSDPNPLNGDEILDTVAAITDSNIWRIPLPGWLAKGSLAYVPGVHALLRIEPAAIDYFTLPTHYTCENTLRDLAGSGIACPPFAEYAPTLIEFMRQNPSISSEAMV
ncbi:MAG: SDR family oxidoreductase [Ardenticatenaceae bacterium]|nr:SDR family oxidoreductase [Anaerolineales bacterium]MCB8923669.1 SDR family oxidoreductase [Ardenticatenaceae bacterium]